jgi:hypothetical protein
VTTPPDEAPRAPTGPGFRDVVSYAWGDADAGLFGSAQLELTAAPDGVRALAGGHAVLFGGRTPAAARAASGLPLAWPAAWDAVRAAGVQAIERAPLQQWDVRFEGDDGRTGFALRFEALSPPGTRTTDSPSVVAGGLEGYEQLCRVTGIATVGGEERAIDCLGQRGHAWGAPTPGRVGLVRTVSAWLDAELALSLTAVRPRRAGAHADEAVDAALFTSLDDAGTVAAVAIDEARLSTTSDADGRVRRAGLEVFLDEEDPGHRAAGAVICGTTLDLGDRRLDCAFVAWRMEGHTGVGRYDVLHEAS